MNEFENRLPEEEETTAPAEVTEEVTAESDSEPAPAVTPGNEKKAKRFNLRTNRKLRLGATATAFTVIVLAVIMLINVVVSLLADRFPVNLDLTADKTYTLSEESRDLAKGMSADVQVKVFYDENAFANPSTGYDELNTILRQFYVFSKDYVTLSNGHIQLEYIDLEAHPELQANYTDHEIASGDILFLCGNQSRKISLSDLYSENYDENYNSSISSLVEQKLASCISGLCGGKSVTLTFLTGHGEDSNVISALADTYSANGYTVTTVDYTTAQEIDESTGALMLVGPVTDYSLDEITRLRTWLQNDGKLGRSLFVFCNYAGTCPNLYDFLQSDYGIEVTDKMVVETDPKNCPMTIYGSNPYFPLTTVDSTDITGDISDQKVILPMTLQLKTHKSEDEQESLTNHVIASFPESARLITIEELATVTDEEDLTQLPADSYPVAGVAYAHERTLTADQQAVNTYVVVNGSCRLSDYLSNAQYKNPELLTVPMRTVCSLGDTVILPSTAVSGAMLSFTAFGMGMLYALFGGVTLLLLILCVGVFLRRRHL